MVKIGTPMTPVGKKAILCGSGELGKEVAIELQRYGVEVIALDKYANAPAMQVAHRSYVLSMLDGERLREIIENKMACSPFSSSASMRCKSFVLKGVILPLRTSCRISTISVSGNVAPP